jgi:DNA-directed RNA polymerase beta subunit
MELTYEDGMVLSRSAAKKFEYTAYVSVQLNPAVSKVPNVGDTVEPYGESWWQNHFKGEITSRRPGSNGKVAITVSATCYPVNGDKLTTLHGQKGVITILEDVDMPLVKGTRVELVIGSSSVIKRETISQVLEP